MSARPIDESSRQRELDTYHVLDSLPENAYDDIARLASMLCGAPIALVSLIDRDRQWFKAREGLDLAGGARSEAFCDHAIREPDRLMEVADATRDSRFAGNPFVTGDSAIRFYAGMPLVTPSGAAIGTVCVLDREPRTLDARQRDALASLARLTMNLLEGRKRERALERAALQPAPVTDVSPDAEPQPDAGYTLALFQLQDFAGVVERLGERTTERLLQQLDEAFEACLQPGPSQAVHRVTGDPEFIVVLQGRDHAATLQCLRECLPRFEREHGLRILAGIAEAQASTERLDAVYRRADEALSAEKDRRGGHAAH